MMMNSVQISLSDRQVSVLDEIARELGRSREELLEGAVKQLIAGFEQDRRRDTMRRARGIWSSRQVPNLAIRADRTVKGK